MKALEDSTDVKVARDLLKQEDLSSWWEWKGVYFLDRLLFSSISHAMEKVIV